MEGELPGVEMGVEGQNLRGGGGGAGGVGVGGEVEGGHLNCIAFALHCTALYS